MKKVIAFVLMSTLIATVGCNSQSSSPRGGGMTQDVGFKIVVPTFNKEIMQGQTQNVTVLLERGKYFKQDVTLKIETSKGISIDPAIVMIEASEKPDVQLRIAAAQNAAFGEYRISVKGTPETGEPTSTTFTLKVVTP